MCVHVYILYVSILRSVCLEALDKGGVCACVRVYACVYSVCIYIDIYLNVHIYSIHMCTCIYIYIVYMHILYICV